MLPQHPGQNWHYGLDPDEGWGVSVCQPASGSRCMWSDEWYKRGECNVLLYECSTLCYSDDRFDFSDAENVRITFDLRHAELQYPPDPLECPFAIGLGWIEGGEYHERGNCFNADWDWTHLEMLCPEASGGSDAFIYM